jgi:hypothetical protein
MPGNSMKKAPFLIILVVKELEIYNFETVFTF